MSAEDKAWFLPKLFGYGAGVPIAWQGWALIAGFLAIALGCGLLIEWDQEVGMPAGIFILVVSAVAFILISKAKTRGEWRWRWGKFD